MGTPPGEGDDADGERPVHAVSLSPFAIAPTTVTNAEYAAFCDDTGFVTVAERNGWSFVFGASTLRRLPTEAEWEFAARGGLDQRRLPWGDDLEPGGVHMMNVFQGDFPGRNTCADGYAGSAPVRTFPPNGFGLHETTGNVWEWCADWLSPTTYSEAERRADNRELLWHGRDERTGKPEVGARVEDARRRDGDDGRLARPEAS
jgi:formylglycine-generating enzyme required for sulfatase activity